MPELIFELKNVHFAYPGGVAALKGLNLAVQKGERVAVIGANGTGKSTLLAMLDALIFPDSGEATAFGRPLTPKTLNDAEWQREFRRRAGYVFQNPDVQLFCPTVREDIAFGPLQLGAPKDEIRSRLDAIAGRLRIEPLLDRSPHRLSLGEKKKAAIAGVLAMEPDVLLLDEPTSGLDPQTTRDIIAVIHEYHQSGKTVVMATHDLHIVEEIADVVHVFDQSKSIIRSGPPHEIFEDQEFLKEKNLIHIHVHRHPHKSHVHSHGHPG